MNPPPAPPAQEPEGEGSHVPTMGLDEQIAGLTARVDKLERATQGRARFALQYILVPLLVALCGVGGGLWVARQNSEATLEGLRLARRLDAVARYSEAATLLVNHINDLVEARQANDARRRIRLEDQVSEDLARLAGAIAALRPYFSSDFGKECDDLTAHLATLSTATIPRLDGNSEIVRRLRQLRASIDREIAQRR